MNGHSTKAISTTAVATKNSDLQKCSFTVFLHFPTVLRCNYDYQMLNYFLLTTIAMLLHMFVSLSTVVLNSRDCHENLWLPNFLHF